MGEPTYKFDKYPQLEDVKDLTLFNNLDDNSIQSIMCDPPFVIKTETTTTSSIIKNRFHYYSNVKELKDTQTELLEMCYNKLKQGGILIYKIQDTKCNKGQIWTHQYIMNEAERIGYLIEDICIKVNKNPMPIRGVQKSFRKNHSYFIVLRKK